MAAGERPVDRSKQVLRAAVCAEVIANDLHLATEFEPQVVEEPDEVFRLRFVIQESEEHPDASPLGRQRKGRDHTDSIVPSPLVEYRCIADRSPGATHLRPQHEPRFVDEVYASLIFFAPY